MKDSVIKTKISFTFVVMEFFKKKKTCFHCEWFQDLLLFQDDVISEAFFEGEDEGTQSFIGV